MHDGAKVVGSDIVTRIDILAEIGNRTGRDILPENPHTGVPILAGLLVPQTHSVSEFVNDVSSRAAIANDEPLPSHVDHTDIARTPAAANKSYVVSLCCTRDEPDH